MRKNIAAFTETHVSMPGYVSINSEDDGSNSITVRTRTSGQTGVIHLSNEQLIDLAYDILNTLQKPTPVVEDAPTPKAEK